MCGHQAGGNVPCFLLSFRCCVAPIHATALELAASAINERIYRDRMFYVMHHINFASEHCVIACARAHMHYILTSDACYLNSAKTTVNSFCKYGMMDIEAAALM